MARTVLLADDSVTAQNMGRRILMDAGYEVITVNNGSAALKKIHESRPDLIVLDVYMPGYGGLEVCQRLKESDETVRIPVLLTVGKMEPFKTDEAKRVRADGHIVKPFEASELLAALTRLEDRIVPEERGRGRKSKSDKASRKPEPAYDSKPEKKGRFWHVADPATTYDDSQSENISYLAQVKQRHTPSDSEPREIPDARDVMERRESAAPALMAEAEVPEVQAQRRETPPLPEAAGELPVVPEPAPSDAEEAVAAEARPYSEEVAPVEAHVEAEPAPVQEIAEAPSGEPTSVEPVDAAPVVQSSLEIQGTMEAPAEAADEVQLRPAEEAAVPEPANTPVQVVEPGPVEAPSSPTPPARWVAENVALTAEEASLELEREMQQAAEVSAAKVEEVHETVAPEQVTEATALEPTVEPDKSTGNTFAAAAAVSSAVSRVTNASEVESEPRINSEAAAAWKNWEQIRDSVMSPQQASDIAESVAQAAKAVAPPPAETASEDHSAPALEGAALASIVDTVLAELKPKLMEEIAKKLKR